MLVILEWFDVKLPPEFDRRGRSGGDFCREALKAWLPEAQNLTTTSASPVIPGCL
mgnify:CR=1 FL=1